MLRVPSRLLNRCLSASLVLAAAPLALAQTERVLPGETSTAWGVSFSPDGKRLLTAADAVRVRPTDGWRTSATLKPASVLVVEMFDKRLALSQPGIATAAVQPDGSYLMQDPILPPSELAKVMSLTTSRDGKVLAAGGEDGKVVVIDLARGKTVVLNTKAHEGAVLSLALSSNGKVLVTGGKDKKIKLWDLAKVGSEARLFDGSAGEVRALALSKDGKKIVSCTPADAWTWDVKSAAHTVSLGRSCASAAFSADGNWLAVGSDELTVWRVSKAGVSPQRRGNEAIQALAFSPDSKWLAISHGDKGGVRVYETASFDPNNLKLNRAQGHTKSIAGLALTSDSTTAATVASDGVRVFNIKSGRIERVLPLAGDTIKADARGQLLFVGQGGTIKVFDRRSGAARYDIASGVVQVTDFDISRDGKTLVVAGGDAEKKVRIVTLSPTGAIDSKTLELACTAVAFAPSGKEFALGCQDGGLRIYGLDGAEKKILGGQKQRIFSVAYSADSKKLASLATDGTVKVVDSASAETIASYVAEKSAVRRVALHPAGKLVAFGFADGSVLVWDSVAKADVLRVQAHDEKPADGYVAAVTALAFTSDGKNVLSASGDHSVNVIGLAEQKVLRSLGAYAAWAPGEQAIVDDEAAPALKALFEAAQNGSVDAVKAAVASAVKLDARQSRGWTALMVACDYNQVAVVKELIKAGADVTLRRPSGETCLSSAARKGYGEVAALALTAGADPNATNKQNESVLVLASSGGHDDIVDLLLRRGADPNAVYGLGFSALHMAASKGNTKEVAQLLKAGAWASLVATDGRTPLHVADGKDVVKALATQLGVDVNAKDAQGKTPLERATQENRAVAAQALRDLGAK